MKRFMGLWLGVVVALVTTIPALAAGSANITVSVTPNTNLRAGDVITATVLASPMTNLSSMQFDLVYDENALELVSGSSDITGIHRGMMSIQNPNIPGGIRVAAISASDVTTNTDSKLLTAQFRVKSSSGSVQFDLTEYEFYFAMEQGEVKGTLSTTASIGGNTAPAPSAPKSSPFNDPQKVAAAMENVTSQPPVYIPPDLQAQMDNVSEPQPVYLPGVNLPTVSAADDDIMVTPDQNSSSSVSSSGSGVSSSGSVSSTDTSSSGSVSSTDTSSSSSNMVYFSSDGTPLDNASAPEENPSQDLEASAAGTESSSAGGVTYYPDAASAAGAISLEPGQTNPVETVMQRVLLIALGLLLGALVIGGVLVLVLRRKKK